MKFFTTYKPSIGIVYIYILLISSLIFQNIIEKKLLFLNQINGIYSTESDSISIPIYITLLTTFLILIINLIGIYLVTYKWINWIGIGLTFISFMFALGLFIEWFLPNDLLLTTGQIPTALIYGYISFKCINISKQSSKLSPSTDSETLYKIYLMK